jgi:hypothetical protein
MAKRPLTFGMRLRDKGRTVRVRDRGDASGRYVVEDEQKGRETRRRVHASLQSALADTASTWRGRLH